MPLPINGQPVNPPTQSYGTFQPAQPASDDRTDGMEFQCLQVVPKGQLVTLSTAASPSDLAESLLQPQARAAATRGLSTVKGALKGIRERLSPPLPQAVADLRSEIVTANKKYEELHAIHLKMMKRHQVLLYAEPNVGTHAPGAMGMLQATQMIFSDTPEKAVKRRKEIVDLEVKMHGSLLAMSEAYRELEDLRARWDQHDDIREIAPRLKCAEFRSQFGQLIDPTAKTAADLLHISQGNRSW